MKGKCQTQYQVGNPSNYLNPIAGLSEAKSLLSAIKQEGKLFKESLLQFLLETLTFL